MSKVLVLGDSHLPWPDWEVLEEAAKFNKEFKAHHVISVGDLTDQKTWSKYGREPDDLGNSAEWDLVRERTKRLIKLFPKMTIIIGNHDIRYFKAAAGAGIPSQLVRSLEEAIPSPGWRWHDTSKGPLMIDGVGYIHGDEESGSALIKAKIVGHPIVQGHDHKGFLEYHQSPLAKRPIWGMSAGSTADKASPGLRYAAKKLKKSFICFAVVENGVPRLYPKGSTK